MKAKKVMAVLMCAAVMLSAAACGSTPASDVTESATAENQEETETKAETDTNETDTSEGAQSETKGLAPYEETVTVNLGHGLDPNAEFNEGESIDHNFYLDCIKEDLNIEINYDWVCADSDFEQKINLCIASNTLPDAMNVGQTQYLAMLKYDQIQPLEDVFEEYASEQLKRYVESGGDALMEEISKDGHMYAIPAPSMLADGLNLMWIRQDWLDELGLNVPSTVDEVMEVAQAFMDNNMGGDNTIGILGPASNGKLVNVGGNIYGYGPIFASYQSFPKYWLQDENGEIYYGSVQPETKEALAKLAEMYEKGIIDHEILVRSDSQEVLLSGQSGIFFGPTWCSYTFGDMSLTGDVDWQAYLVPLADDGNYYATLANLNSNYVCVRKDYEHPEAAIKLINYLIENEQYWKDMGNTADTASIYPLYNVYDNADEVIYTYEQIKKLLAGEVQKEEIDLTGRKLLQYDLDAVEVLKLDPKDDFSIQYWDCDNELASNYLPRLISIMVGEGAAYESDYIPVRNVYNGQTDTMAAKWANLEKMEEEAFAKIVLGQASIDEFDTFVEKWYAEGGEDILKEISQVVVE